MKRMQSMIIGSRTTMFPQGDVVLVPFPFTDLTRAKTRPVFFKKKTAYEIETGNFMVAMITSIPQSTSYDYEVKDWRTANLLAPSWVRIKIATINPKLVRYKPGSLANVDLIEVDKRIRLALGL